MKPTQLFQRHWPAADQIGGSCTCARHRAREACRTRMLRRRAEDAAHRGIHAASALQKETRRTPSSTLRLKGAGPAETRQVDVRSAFAASPNSMVPRQAGKRAASRTPATAFRTARSRPVSLNFRAHSWFTGAGVADDFVSNAARLGEDGPEEPTSAMRETPVMP
ncbi:MAG: hypothetical protein AAF676_11950 [Pseudomonadota bacterium]